MSITISNPNPQTEPNDGAPMEGAHVPSVESLSSRSLDKVELLERIIRWHRQDRDHFQRFRQEAAEMYDFRAGNQWTDEDLSILADQLRPAITFNRIGPFVDAVGGLEINNRQETRYSPRQVGNAGVDDVLTGAAQWVRQECDAEDEETEAFLDVVICGLACVRTRLDFDDDPDGVIVMERVNPLEMYPDASSKKQNFADGRHLMRIKDVPLEDARTLAREALKLPLSAPIDDQMLDAQWARDEPDSTRTPHNARLAPYYRIDQAGEIDRDTQVVRMAEVEWWQFEPAWRVLDPQSGRFVLLDDAAAMRWTVANRLSGVRPTMYRDRKKRYYKAIVGAEVIKIMDGPEAGGFEHKFITGKRDAMKAVWYGLVRPMKDPQMWANKWLSQGLHILNTNAKGGYFAETDAFADIDEARNSLASADSIVEVNPGKLGAIEPKQPPAFPPQLNTMMEMATQAIPMVSGINMEMLGQSTSTAPQVALLETGRKQQGMNILASLFNAKRRYQKEQGRLLLWMIQTYIADGRLIRIGGPENAQYVPLIHTPGLAEYDVIVDDGPTSTNMKERCWAALMQLFPMLRGMPVTPQLMASAVKYGPFPQELSNDLTQAFSQPPPPNPAAQGKAALDNARAQTEQGRGMVHQAQAGKLQAETNKLNAETQTMPMRHALDLDEQKAKIEKMRADAANALQNAGLTSDDAQFQRAMDAVNAILSMHNASLAQNDQSHQHGMDLLGHSLAMDQAQQPEPTPQGVNQ